MRLVELDRDVSDERRLCGRLGRLHRTTAPGERRGMASLAGCVVFPGASRRIERSRDPCGGQLHGGDAADGAVARGRFHALGSQPDARKSICAPGPSRQTVARSLRSGIVPGAVAVFRLRAAFHQHRRGGGPGS